MIPPRFSAALGVALALWASPAAADIRIRLDSAVIDRCPDAATIADRWRARSGSAATVELHILEVSGRLLGVVRTSAEGQPPAARRLRAERDACSALIHALLTSAALLTVTLELPPPAPAEPAEQAELAEPAGPSAGPSADGPDTPSAALPDGAGVWRGALGVRGDVGAAPGISVLGELGLSHRWSAASVGGTLHAGAAPASAVGAGAVSIERYAASIHGCWHAGALGVCGLTRAGVVALRPDGLDGADVLETLLEAGARGAWRVALSDGWGLVADVEVAAPLRALRLSVDGAPVWQASPVSVGAGLALQWAP